MDDACLIENLIHTCTHQRELYRELNGLSQKVLSQVILSRGDLSGIAPALTKKQQILELIAVERNRSQPWVTLWQARKNELEQMGKTASLEKVLGEMEQSIRQFIDKEDQLKRYLEHAMGRSSTS